MKKTLLLALLFGLFLSVKALAKNTSYQSHVVQITVYSQEPDFDAPWRQKRVGSNVHLGVMVAREKVLVAAHAVAYHTMLELSLVGDSEKIPMVVSHVDYNANLALIEPKEKGALFKRKLKPIKLGNDIPMNTEVTLVYGRHRQRLYQAPARLREVSIKQVLTSSYAYSHYLFEVRKTTGLGWSELLVDKNNKMIGLAVGQDSETLYAIPVKIIKHFLKDTAAKKYRGFTMLGLGIRKLDSPHLRDYLNLEKDANGVLVSKVYGNSAFLDKLKPYDVITHFGDVPISRSGYYEHKVWGKVHFVDLLAGYHAGDKIKLTILRDGKKKVLSAVSRAYDQQEYLIPGYPFSGVSHLIFGGFLFQELNLGFLKTWGDGFHRTAPEEMVYKFSYHNEASKGQKKRVIVLNKVLSDPHNKGYQSLSNVIVREVNGRKIESFADLKEALKNPENPKKKLARFLFSAGGGEVILDYNGLDEAHQRIAKNYHIQEEKTFFHLKNESF